MKNIATPLVLSVLLMQSANADCREEYRIFLEDGGTQSSLPNLPAISSSAIGTLIISPLISSQIEGTGPGVLSGSADGPSSDDASSEQSTYSLGFGFLIGGGVMLFADTEGPKAKKEAYEVIKEAYVGSGGMLSTLTESLSRITSKDLSEKDVAAVIIEENVSKAWCNDGLVSYEALKRRIANRFR